MLDKLRRKDERTETERLTDKGGREMEGKGREGEEGRGSRSSWSQATADHPQGVRLDSTPLAS